MQHMVVRLCYISIMLDKLCFLDNHQTDNDGCGLQVAESDHNNILPTCFAGTYQCLLERENEHDAPVVLQGALIHHSNHQITLFQLVYVPTTLLVQVAESH